nr:hypothetical protein [Tanacetum cinerariifolium]
MEHNIDQDSSCEQDDDLEDDQEEDGDDRDTFDMWDIMIGDIERIRQFLTPNVPEDIEELEKLLANDPKPHNLEIQDEGKFTWGGRARVFGTVSVVLGAQEARMGCWVKMAGKWVRAQFG